MPTKSLIEELLKNRQAGERGNATNYGTFIKGV